GGLTFPAREAKRLFGIFSAGGSLGAILGGFGSTWTVNLFTGTDQLFWLIGALFGGAFGVVWFAGSELNELQTVDLNPRSISGETEATQPTAPVGRLWVS